MSLPTLVVLFAALAAVCALLAIHSSQKCARLLTEMRATVASLASMRSRVEAHDLEIERTAEALRSLRGRFYQERSKWQPASTNSGSGEEATDAGTLDVASLKAQLRRKAGLVAGRPAPHRE